jgi:hypothetical protein
MKNNLNREDLRFKTEGDGACLVFHLKQFPPIAVFNFNDETFAKQVAGNFIDFLCNPPEKKKVSGTCISIGKRSEIELAEIIVVAKIDEIASFGPNLVFQPVDISLKN